VKKNPPLPTVTVTVAALAAPRHNARSEVIVTAVVKMRDKELFIARIPPRENSNNLLPHAMLKK
jgi:hypothetical protein